MNRLSPTIPSSSTAELERKYKQLLKRPGGSLFEDDVVEVRLELRDRLEQIILLDYDLASKTDVEGTLWKLVHYKAIEEFRRLHRDVNGRVRRSGRPEDKKELRNLTAAFRAFLFEASAFYAQMIFKLDQRYDLKGRFRKVMKELLIITGQEYSTEPRLQLAEGTLERMVSTGQRTLIYLGDLSRYHEIHADRKESKWGLAKLFYNLAALVLPTNGNPYNQLAVISSYEGSEPEAVENYMRSLLIERPFATALENLEILFDKVQKRVKMSPLSGAASDRPKAVLDQFVVLVANAVGRTRSLSSFLAVQAVWLDSMRSSVIRSQLDHKSVHQMMIVGAGMVQMSQGEKELYSAVRSFFMEFINMVADQTTSDIMELGDANGEVLREIPAGWDDRLNVILTAMAWVRAEFCSNSERLSSNHALRRGLASLYSALISCLPIHSDDDRLDPERMTTEEAALEHYLPFRPYFKSLPAAKIRDITHSPISGTGQLLLRIVNDCSFWIEHQVLFLTAKKSSKTVVLVVSPQAPVPQHVLPVEVLKDVVRGIPLDTAITNHRSNNGPNSTQGSGFSEMSREGPQTTGTTGGRALSQDGIWTSSTGPSSFGHTSKTNVQPHSGHLASPTTPLTASQAQIWLPQGGDLQESLSPSATFYHQEARVDEDAFGHKIVLPTEADINFAFGARGAQPMSVPRKSPAHPQVSQSPDTGRIFGTSSDAVDTLAFLGLGPSRSAQSGIRDHARMKPPLGNMMDECENADTFPVPLFPPGMGPPSLPRLNTHASPPSTSAVAFPLSNNGVTAHSQLHSAPPGHLTPAWSGEYTYPFGKPVDAEAARQQSAPAWTEAHKVQGPSSSGLTWMGAGRDAFVSPMARAASANTRSKPEYEPQPPILGFSAAAGPSRNANLWG
ncbi:uncharacterized protein EV422DRAFT_420329 [Fimicolochytrium jonesii]|uniref:uncharacterized protein n=1 Tax=Fimicolochytrium jonesii TaxID=1396493 RepID=UPI0022FF2664|nr:uncharacterized protein EV422DRAFT_420329 [Fimicolochytrium jonesii]KAI8822185.1 hypothetical protein EV422DRAFT_420329 [Fimicolochytrium jonesii]